MLKRIIYTDFGQFIAALKSAERLGLRYRVERREVAGTISVLKQPPMFAGLNPDYKPEFSEKAARWTEYTLDLLPDEAGEADEQATA